MTYIHRMPAHPLHEIRVTGGSLDDEVYERVYSVYARAITIVLVSGPYAVKNGPKTDGYRPSTRLR